MNSLARSLLDALYLTIALATSVVAMAVWIAGVSVTISLAVFIVGLPVFLLSTLAFRWTAELDRRNAALVLGRPLRGRYRPQRGGLIARLLATARDPQTWKDHAWLVVHSALGLAVLPVWYWSITDGVELGLWDVDTLWEAFATAPLAIPLALVTALLLRAMATAHAKLARALLA